MEKQTGSLTCRDLTTGQVVKDFQKKGRVAHVAWAQDGKRAYTVDYSDLICYDMASMQEEFQLAFPGCYSVVVSRDNRFAVITTGINTIFVDLKTQRPLGEVKGAIRNSAFFAGGDLLLAAKTADVLDVYDVVTQQKLASWPYPAKNLRSECVVVAPSENFALVGGFPNIYYFPLPLNRNELQNN